MKNEQTKESTIRAISRPSKGEAGKTGDWRSQISVID